jgi:hypothetical protein
MALALALVAASAMAQAAGPDCAALRDEYRSALTLAQACDPASTRSCAARRPADLEDPCHCPVSVNPSRTRGLDRLQARYRKQGCEPVPPFCNRACVVPLSECGTAPDQSHLCGAR